jgi:hypothetical protein
LGQAVTLIADRVAKMHAGRTPSRAVETFAAEQRTLSGIAVPEGVLAVGAPDYATRTEASDILYAVSEHLVPASGE